MKKNLTRAAGFLFFFTNFLKQHMFPESFNQSSSSHNMHLGTLHPDGELYACCKWESEITDENCIRNITNTMKMQENNFGIGTSKKKWILGIFLRPGGHENFFTRPVRRKQSYFFGLTVYSHSMLSHFRGLNFKIFVNHGE